MKSKMTSRQGPIAACLAGTLLAAALGASAFGTESVNPYLSIVERNPFGLKPLPPPPDPNAAADAKAAATKVIVTGITTLFGPDSKRALLEIEEPPAEKGQKGTTSKPILGEGQRFGPVEIVSIDIDKNIVKIRNNDVESDLTFEKSKPATGAAPAAGGPPSRVPPPFGQPARIAAASAAAVSAPNSGATVISKNSGMDSGNSGVVLYGGQPINITPTAAPVAPAGGASLATASTHPGLMNTFRPLRTDTVGPQVAADAPPANVKPISREEALLHMEVLRTANANNPNFPPLPPTELTDMVNAEQQQLQQQRLLQQQQQNRGFPPSPFGPPPVPGR
jgi:hypothetical protein